MLKFDLNVLYQLTIDCSLYSRSVHTRNADINLPNDYKGEKQRIIYFLGKLLSFYSRLVTKKAQI